MNNKAFMYLICLLITATQFSVSEEVPTTAERATWSAIFEYTICIERESQKFGIDPKLIFSILYVEKIQYEVTAVLRAKDRIENMVQDLDLFTDNIARWANLSIGFAHIKPRFAIETRQRLELLGTHRGYVSESMTLPSQYSIEPCIATRLMAASLYVFTEQWASSEYEVDLNNRPMILATLYNLGYDKSQPKSDPTSGGSYLPIFLNGHTLTGLDFGQKVSMVMRKSEILLSFLDQPSGGEDDPIDLTESEI